MVTPYRRLCYHRRLIFTFTLQFMWVHYWFPTPLPLFYTRSSPFPGHGRYHCHTHGFLNFGKNYISHTRVTSPSTAHITTIALYPYSSSRRCLHSTYSLAVLVIFSLSCLPLPLTHTPLPHCLLRFVTTHMPHPSFASYFLPTVHCCVGWFIHFFPLHTFALPHLPRWDFMD